jgi:hypothetical protein
VAQNGIAPLYSLCGRIFFLGALGGHWGRDIMSNRDALRRLIRQFPTPEEIESTLDALEGANDGTAATIAAALLEVKLEKLIRSSRQSLTENPHSF